MKKIIIPVDFSDTAEHAARFAAGLTDRLKETSLILYHVFDVIAAGSDGSPLGVSVEDRKKIAESTLELLKSKLALITSAPITVRAEAGSLSENLPRLFEACGADLVVMGMNGSSRIEQILIGSTTLRVIRNSSFPVLIVPPGTTCTSIKKCLLASDFRDVENHTPAHWLYRILSFLQPELHVIHVGNFKDPEKQKLIDEQKERMDYLLGGYHPRYCFIESSNFLKGINDYVQKQNIDMIITIPGETNVLQNIFRTTHTDKLAYHSRIPVLAIHE
jgi:nucleotide-binding universal stress UspA family protein